ncbi:MAG: hypothetical protein NTW87_11815 [Planctomycetota bacterium]|nr:hypothetical protein [Planctomycetota bacterium]
MHWERRVYWSQMSLAALPKPQARRVSDIPGAALKGGSTFNLNKPDVASFKGTVELPAVLEVAWERTCRASAGNVVDRRLTQH